MREATYETRVQGMICRQCEDITASALMRTRGVIDARASYWKNSVTARYDPDIVSESELAAALDKAGYPVGGGGASGVIIDLVCLAAAAALYFLIPSIMSALPSLKVGEAAGFGFIFLVGLLTGVHCIGMCGGIMLSQTAGGEARQGILSALCYNGGRVITCVCVGALFGAIGSVISYTPNVKSMVFTLCGGLVAFIGLQMWGVIPGLRRLGLELPGACALPGALRRRWLGRPLIIGLLTGFMPCGALSAMWVYAMGSGGALSGALSMLAFSLGTVPAMLLFGALGSLLPASWRKWMAKLSAVLVVALGLIMLTKGIRLFPK